MADQRPPGIWIAVPNGSLFARRAMRRNCGVFISAAACDTELGLSAHAATALAGPGAGDGMAGPRWRRAWVSEQTVSLACSPIAHRPQSGRLRAEAVGSKPRHMPVQAALRTRGPIFISALRRIHSVIPVVCTGRSTEDRLQLGQHPHGRPYQIQAFI